MGLEDGAAQVDVDRKRAILSDETMRKYRAKYTKMGGQIAALKKLPEMAGIEDLLDYEKSRGLKYPVLTNEYFTSLFDLTDIDDPVRKLVVPTMEELEATQKGTSGETGVLDTSGEAHNAKGGGLQHKYTPTALTLTSNSCFGLCRECFRKRLFIDGKVDQSETVFPNAKSIEYLKQHKEINTILLSGGDALRLSNDTWKSMFHILHHPELDHISTIRIGTKALAFYPQRVDEELCDILQEFQNRSGKSVHVCVHFEHPREVTPEAIAACKMIRDHGLVLYNQTVLLGGVNDDPQIIYDLWEALQKCGVRPYFLFQCRPVLGSKDMQVSLKRGIAIMAKVNARTTGIHKPRYAMSTIWGKMEIMGVNPRNPNEIVIRQHSAKSVCHTNELIFYDVSKNDPYWFTPTNEKQPQHQQPQRGRAGSSCGCDFAEW